MFPEETDAVDSLSMRLTKTPLLDLKAKHQIEQNSLQETVWVAQKEQFGEKDEGEPVMIQKATKFLDSQMGKQVTIRKERG